MIFNKNLKNVLVVFTTLFCMFYNKKSGNIDGAIYWKSDKVLTSRVG